MVWKLWLRMSILSVFLLAGCVQPTPTPAGTATPGAGGAYPGLGPTATPFPPGYPASQATPAAESTQSGSPYPAPTTGAAARLAPL